MCLFFSIFRGNRPLAECLRASLRFIAHCSWQDRGRLARNSLPKLLAAPRMGYCLQASVPILSITASLELLPSLWASTIYPRHRLRSSIQFLPSVLQPPASSILTITTSPPLYLFIISFTRPPRDIQSTSSCLRSGMLPLTRIS